MRALDILVVDDDVDFAESMADMLGLAGHAVDVVHSGEAAIQHRQQHYYDLVFLDLALPGIDGLDALQQIHLVGYSPAVIMTAHATSERLERLPSSGAVELLLKPCEISKVMQVVQRRAEFGSVLVVDDDVDFLDSMRDALQQRGFTVFTEVDAERALSRLRECRAAALVLDMRMPNRHGLDIYRELAEHGAHVPVVLVTAYAEEVRHTPMGLLDVNVEVLRKPFSPDRLWSALALAGEKRAVN